MTEPRVATDYEDRGVRAARTVLIEIGQVLGAFRDKFVVIGGAVPWLLLDQAEPPHVGTLDIDLDLDPEALAEGEYATLVQALEAAGYERGADGMRPFQLRRTVKVDEGDPIPVIVDLLMPREARPQKNRPPLVGEFAVQKADGAKLALEHSVFVTLSGAMPDGRNNTVQIRVATIPASLAMKGYALMGRAKNKDAYDIYFEVRNFPGGPTALAKDCQPLLSDPVAVKGYQFIAEKFSDPDGYGPQTVRQFLTESDALGGMTPEQVQRDAFGQVYAWIKALGLPPIKA